MLSIADLDTYYGDSHILRGAGLELPAGTALGLLGRVQEARASVAELLRMRPDFARRGRTIIGHYIKPQDVRDRIAEGCRKAGLTLL